MNHFNTMPDEEPLLRACPGVMYIAQSLFVPRLPGNAQSVGSIGLPPAFAPRPAR